MHGHVKRLQLDLELPHRKCIRHSRRSFILANTHTQSFFTPFITSAIDFRYGYIFAACSFVAAPIVYFFLEEHQGRTLEEIDTMYITHVPPRKSSKWTPPEGEDLITADKLFLEPGARGIRKQDEGAGREEAQQTENVASSSSRPAGV